MTRSEGTKDSKRKLEGGRGRGVAPKSTGSGRRPAGSNHIWRTGRNGPGETLLTCHSESAPAGWAVLATGRCRLQGGKCPGLATAWPTSRGAGRARLPHPTPPLPGALSKTQHQCKHTIGPSLRRWPLTLTDHGPGSPVMALRRWEGVWVDYLGGGRFGGSLFLSGLQSSKR